MRKLDVFVESGVGSFPGVHIRALAGLNYWQIKSWLPYRTAAPESPLLSRRRLPYPVGTMVSGPDQVLCLAPTEWWLVSKDRSDSGQSEPLVTDVQGHNFVAVNLADGFVGLEVRGPVARTVLAKGCGLDFHLRAFPAGRCARTRFAQIPVVIVHEDDTECFQLHVARSYSQYLSSWLNDAALEFAEGSKGPDGSCSSSIIS